MLEKFSLSLMSTLMLAVMTCCFFVTSLSADDKEIDKNQFVMVINSPEGTPLYQLLSSIYADIFERANIELDLRHYPLARASLMAKKGMIDGEPARIFEYGASHPNLVRVEESPFDMSTTAYATSDIPLAVAGWEGLRGKNFMISYPTGLKVVSLGIEGIVEKENISTVTNIEQGLSMLALNRVDLFLSSTLGATPILPVISKKYNVNFYPVSVIVKKPTYFYVNKKHQELVPVFEEIISKMKDEGAMQKYIDKFFKPAAG